MAGRVTSFNVQGEDYRVEADLQFDSTPTLGSTNPVTSNGIAVALSAVSIGDNISYGRTEGTPIGYCSISYGNNNTATNDYGIVFGSRNVVTSPGTIASGYSNIVSGSDGGNAALGNSNHINGSHNLVAGSSNFVSGGWQYITSDNYPSSKKTVYIGYVNTSTRKIYTDVDMTSEISVPALGYNDQTGYYFIQITNGVVYHYYREYGAYHFITVQKNNFVNLTNICHSTSFVYNGVAYYKASNDTLYSDPSMTSAINYGTTGQSVWLDANGGEIILLNDRGELPWQETPKYSRITTYNGYYNPTSNLWSRQAYVIDNYNVDDRWHVYDSNGRDITDELYNGECIISLAGSPNSHGEIYSQYNSGRVYKYTFDTNHRMIGVRVLDYASMSLVCGDNNNIGAGTSGVVLGLDNESRGAGGGVFIAGNNNTIKNGVLTGSGADNNCVIGHGNNITLNTNGTGHYPNVVLGGENQIVGGSLNYNSVDSTYVVGQLNKVKYCTKYSTLLGYSNEYGISSNTHVVGQNNEVNFSIQSSVNGYQNIIGRAFYNDPFSGSAAAMVEAKYLESGYLDIQGDNGTTRLPTNTLITIADRARPELGKNREELTAIGHSDDGTSLSTINLSVAYQRALYRIGVYGSFNSVIPSLSTVISGASSISDSLVLGQYNVLGGQNISYVNMLGYYLRYRNNGNPNRSSTVIVGTYNDDDNGLGYISGQNCKFLVGVGTADNDRKNGLAVMSTGTVAAPSCADTVNAALGGWSGDSRKVLVTYGMLQDYAPKTPGAIGKPAQTIVTLTAADWSSFEQTVSLSDMTASAVVLIEPSGNPHAYYTDEIFLSSQAAGSLTFGCSVAPTVDINVKVVYWP